MQRTALMFAIVCALVLPAQAAVFMPVGLFHNSATISGSAIDNSTVPATPLPGFGPTTMADAPGLYLSNILPAKGTATAMAAQTVSFTVGAPQPAGFEITQIIFSGNTSVTAAMYPKVSATASATSLMDIGLQVLDSPALFTFSGEMACGKTSPSIVLYNTAAPATPILTIDQAFVGAGSFDSAAFDVPLLLQPGTYRVLTTVSDSGSARTFATSSSLDYTLTMTTTPEPISLALLAMGGLALLRRRR